MKPVSILSILASTSAFEYTTDYGELRFVRYLRYLRLNDLNFLLNPLQIEPFMMTITVQSVTKIYRFETVIFEGCSCSNY